MEKLKISKVTNVFAESNITTNIYRVGTLYLTPTHIIFTESNGPYENWIVVQHLTGVLCLTGHRKRNPLLLKSKTFHSVILIFTNSREREFVSDSIQKLLSTLGDEELYCLRYKSPEAICQKAGWDLFDEITEFRRIGINETSTRWRMTTVNRNFETCDSYPTLLCVPRCAKKHVLQASANFRKRGRCPVVTFYRPDRDAAICRAARPDEGFSARCIEDERLLVSFAHASARRSLLILDVRRPGDNQPAVAPNSLLEANITIETVTMAGLAELHESLNLMIAETTRGDLPFSTYLRTVSQSGWLQGLHQLLATCARVAQRVLCGENVLVQCATGLDHSAQICSLAQLLLDPFYRSLDGFIVLIEKDWLAFAHPFPWRCQHLPDFAHQHAGPVFLQFLDVVWQLWRQFPAAFEFNEHFLAVLHDHSQGSQFGTFVCNTAKQRQKLRLSSRAYSIWAYVKYHRNRFVNALYRPEIFRDVLRPSLSAKRLRVWNKLYHRSESSFHPRNCPCDLVTALLDQTAMWGAQAELLHTRIFQLAALLKIPDEKMRRQLISVGTGSKTSFASSASSFEILSGRHAMAPSGELRLNGSATWCNRPSGSSIESGLGGSVDSPCSELGAFPLAPISESAQDAEAVSSKGVAKPCDTTSWLSPRCAEGPPPPPLTKDRLRRELGTVKTSWANLRLALTCDGCGQELNNTIPKRHCWLCARVNCLRCLRAPSGPEPLELATFSEVTNVASRFRLCLTCERRLLHDTARD